jgi:hypothetical protein
MRYADTDATKLLVHGNNDPAVIEYTQRNAGELRDQLFAITGGYMMVELTLYVGVHGTYRDTRYVLTVWDIDDGLDAQLPHAHDHSCDMHKTKAAEFVYNDRAEAFAAWSGYIADNTYND